ncbi:MAG: cadherin-like domain-containing protein, partial [Planctomycetes bacterium]|nr:cadherin-like domain-containing protein [Planctomycetota bacterium]
MLLFNWLSSVKTSLSHRGNVRRSKRRRITHRNWPIEQLESRILLAAPTAYDDSYNVTPDTSYNESSPGVLGNDTDPESDPLTAILVADVTDGVLTLYSDGSFDYDPDMDFEGIDTFTYKANDGTNDSNVATVTLDVGGGGGGGNTAPVANDDSYSTDI